MSKATDLHGAKTDKYGYEIEDRIYNQKDFDRNLVIDERTKLVARGDVRFLLFALAGSGGVSPPLSGGELDRRRPVRGIDAEDDGLLKWIAALAVDFDGDSISVSDNGPGIASEVVQQDPGFLHADQRQTGVRVAYARRPGECAEGRSWPSLTS